MRKKRQLDDPRALRDTASGAVIFAISAASRDGLALPGPVVVTILGDLGLSEPTARATILRMRRSGWLVSARRGPVAEYSLSDPARALSVRVQAPITGQRPAWDGGFHGLLFSVPESGRAYRDALRRTAVLAGFGLLRAGLLITADEQRWSRIDQLVRSAPAGSRLLRVELSMSLDDARAAAAEAWPLDELARAYRERAAEMRQVADRYRAKPPTGPAAVRAMWDAMSPISALAIDDPVLPVDLLPPDWPTAEIGAALESLGVVVVPGLQAYFAGLLARRAR